MNMKLDHGRWKNGLDHSNLSSPAECIGILVGGKGQTISRIWRPVVSKLSLFQQSIGKLSSNTRNTPDPLVGLEAIVAGL